MRSRRSIVALAAALAAEAVVGACSVVNAFDPVRGAEPSDPGGGGTGGTAGSGGTGGSGGTAGSSGGPAGSSGTGGTGACEQGTSRCTGRLLESCSADGEWTGGVTCPSHCSAELGCVACAPGTARCTGNSVETCDANGAWGNAAACPSEAPVCASGSCGLPPSCAGGLECGGVSCCRSIELPGGTYLMGRSTVSGASDYDSGGSTNELPEHPATVAGFSLDKYEVTVGRFRKFVEQYTGTAPAAGAGAHPLIAGTGWQSAWNASLPTSQAAMKRNLACDTDYETWTDSVSDSERHAINCVSWYEAMAFCIWDGGRLPTEAEWEYAAAGGSENRLYPWGSQAPDGLRANFSGGAHSPYADVGSTPRGDGRWGQSDLAGGMWEWAYDGYDDDWYEDPCDDCANTTSASNHVKRGGGWYSGAAYVRGAHRYFLSPANRVSGLGFRCARSAP